MKDFRILPLVLMLPIFLSCRSSSSDENITREINVGQFKDIEISAHYVVTFEQADHYSLTITYPERYSRKIIARVRDGKLELSLKRIYHYTGGRPTAHITAPSFEEIELSGASRMEMLGEFQGWNMSMEMSGYAYLTGLNVEAQAFSMELSGATEVENARIRSQRFDAELSGATRYVLDVDSKDADIELSGKSDGLFKLDVPHMELEASAAAHTIFTASEDFLGHLFKLDISGAAKIDAHSLPYMDVDADVSGAAKVTVHPIQSLEARCTGAGSLQYVGTSGLLTHTVVSAGSRLEEITL